MVGEDPYELRIVAQSPDATWKLAGVTVSAEDQAAGVTIKAAGATDGVLKIQITAPANREVRWSVRFSSAPESRGVTSAHSE